MKPLRPLVAVIALAEAFAVLGTPAAAQEASPTPSPSPTERFGCGAPPVQSIDVQPVTVAPGDTATVTVTVRDEPCYADERVRHEIYLFATREPYRDPAPLTSGSTDLSGRFVYVEQVTRSTTYYLGVRDGVRRGGSSTAVVNLSRTSGSCAGVLTLSAPLQAPISSPVTVTGTSSDTSTVRISFRRRGQQGFTVRRTLTPAGSDRSFTFAYTADDDYRLYASSDRCDSQPVLVAVAPVLTGPATARKGSTATLIVRAAPGTPLAVAFRRAGQSTFVTRRTGTADSRGVYTTTYVADADYRYYAVARPGRRSDQGLTQVR